MTFVGCPYGKQSPVYASLTLFNSRSLEVQLVDNGSVCDNAMDAKERFIHRRNKNLINFIMAVL